MFKMFTSMFLSITVFFDAVGRLMNAFESLAKTAEDTAKTFEQEESINNTLKIRKLQKQAEQLDIGFGDLNTEEKL